MPLRATLARAAGAALVLLAAPAWAADDLLSNGSFDAIAAPWVLEPGQATFASLGWSPVDVDGSSSSGSLLVASDAPNVEDFAFVRVCLAAEEDEVYRFGFASFVPAPQTPSGDVASSLHFFPTDNCSGPNHGFEHGRRVREVGSWETTRIGPLAAPGGTRSLRLSMGVRKTELLPGAVTAHFDDAYLLAGADEPEDPPPGPDPDPDPPPEPDPAGWFVDPAFPGFRFNVLITAGGASRPGVPEPVCLPETVCVSGAVPGRVEVLLRIVGPKPNGHLWPTLFKASTARFDVWIEQDSTGTVKHYLLEGAGPGSSDLPGLFDREGFLP